MHLVIHGRRLILPLAVLLAAPAAVLVAGHHVQTSAQATRTAGPAEPTRPLDWTILRRHPVPATPAPPAASESAAPGTSGPAAGSSQPAPVPPASGQLPNFSHVFVIVMENREYGNIIGSAGAPYINSLARGYTLSSNYFAVSHPSLPNYLALTAGSTFGISSDCTTCVVSAVNIGDQVEASGRSWRAYMESMPSPCYLGVGWSGGYAQKHNPFIYFTDIRNNQARCVQHIVPLTYFWSDLSSGNVPTYVWITPNLCHDMHDCATSVGDSWLAGVVPHILGSAAWRNGGVLFITWDEGYSSTGYGDSWGGRVATLTISPYSRNGFQSWVLESHYNLLRTIEDAWRLGALSHAGWHPAMREDFR